MLKELQIRYQLAKLAKIRGSELREAFAKKGLDYDSLGLDVCRALVAEAIVSDTTTAFPKYQRWMTSKMTWAELTADARAAGARVTCRPSASFADYMARSKLLTLVALVLMVAPVFYEPWYLAGPIAISVWCGSVIIRAFSR